MVTRNAPSHLVIRPSWPIDCQLPGLEQPLGNGRRACNPSCLVPPCQTVPASSCLRLAGLNRNRSRPTRHPACPSVRPRTRVMRTLTHRCGPARLPGVLFAAPSDQVLTAFFAPLAWATWTEDMGRHGRQGHPWVQHGGIDVRASTLAIPAVHSIPLSRPSDRHTSRGHYIASIPRYTFHINTSITTAINHQPLRPNSIHLFFSSPHIYSDFCPSVLHFSRPQSHHRSVLPCCSLSTPHSQRPCDHSNNLPNPWIIFSRRTEGHFLNLLRFPQRKPREPALDPCFELSLLVLSDYSLFLEQVLRTFGPSQ